MCSGSGKSRLVDNEFKPGNMSLKNSTSKRWNLRNSHITLPAASIQSVYSTQHNRLRCPMGVSIGSAGIKKALGAKRHLIISLA
ncbi:MAG: hypothetical protein IT223_01625 [Crocinitomicaceae bacterium]|nr:hypothetical protein [Crocinitomicaceae bacterium]